MQKKSGFKGAIDLMQESFDTSFLKKLKTKINSLDSSLVATDLFNIIRHQYIKENLSYNLTKIFRIAEIELPSIEYIKETEKRYLKKIIAEERLYWGDVKFHINYAAKSLGDLKDLVPQIQKRQDSIKNAINKGYLLSILPLNLLLPNEVLENFIPPVDYFKPHPTKHIDPYGIFTKKSKIIDQDTKLLLGSQKFKHSFLMNVHGLCPIGCSDCYKAYYTREEHDLGVTLETLPLQTSAVVKWLNKNPSVYDVIISGGEPLLASNSAIESMLKIFEKAEHLRVLRICTGTLFLGLPMRIDDELLDLLKDFSDRTGVTVRIHANLYNHFQVTPEAIFAIRRIRKRGFNIYSQVPIKEGINFFSHDQRKTLDFLRKLDMAEVLTGVEPYKFIVDMHPRTNMYYVPIEPLIRVWSILAESHDHPEIERPKTLSVLFMQGNIVLSGHLLFAIQKEVDKAKNIVRYYIPLPFDRKKVFIYEEPLIDSNCDPQSLERLKKNWFSIIEQKMRRSTKRT